MKLLRLHIALGLLGAFLPLTTAPAAGPDVSHSKHNLTIPGADKSKSADESDMCHYCHTPHGGASDKPLWNHSPSTATYIPYSSSTLKAKIGQPTGDSKLCLSCHDGTVALGMVRKPKRGVVQRATTRMSPGKAVLGTDLSDDHPVSFIYDSTLAGSGTQLKDPATLNGTVHLDSNHQVQCTSCHDPHSDANGAFLVQNNYASALCLNCHNPTFWAASAHRNSGRTWNGMGRNPWPHTSQSTVAGNGCESCHAPHHAGTHQRLLNLPVAEDNCLVCHNGSVAAQNLAREFNKPSVHPVLTTASLHDEAEAVIIYKARHAACVDCHNPHAANATSALAPNASGALAAVKGVDISGYLLGQVTHEYELCFRCHADSPNKGSSPVLRQWPETNLRLQFAAANASFHPVEAIGKNGQDASLIAPWRTGSLLYCTDCHNNDQGPGAGGAGPNGPHGSQYAPLLERNLLLQDFQPESYAAYALCYKCHSRDVVLNDRLHGQHVRDQKTACSTCHTPHGVQNQTRLINFNTLYVTSLNGRLSFTDLGSGNASCTLNCHGAAHNASSYLNH